MSGFVGVITRVVDGDSLKVSADLFPLVGLKGAVIQDVRLAGVDAPEMTTDAGKAAKAWLAGLAEGKPCLVALYKRERYGRALCDVWLAGEQVTLTDQLIAAGHGVPYDGRPR